MRIRISLLNPPYPVGAHQHAPFISLGILYLAAVLRREGFDVTVLDCQASGVSYDYVARKLEKDRPDIVGVTSTTLTYKPALRIAKIAKTVHPECLVVLGGCHVTFWDAQALSECPSAEVIVRKEGELTMLEIARKVQAGETFEDVLGLTYRKGDEIVRNPDRPYIENLDELPFPAHDLLPIEHLRKTGGLIFPVTTSRGCAFWCEFCTAVRMFGRKYRTRSPKNIADELERLENEYSAEEVAFCDDLFTFDQDRTRKLCMEIIRRGLRLKWTCGTRVDMISRDLLLLMKEAGCEGIWFGVESGSQNMLDKMQKSISVAQTVKAFRWAREVGLRTLAQVILGYPGETKQTAWETVRLVEMISPDEVGFYNVATPFPGTPLYNLAAENGWIKVKDFEKYDTTKPVLETPWLSMKDVERIRELAFLRFYLKPKTIVGSFSKGLKQGLATSKEAVNHLLGALKASI
ncbi:MAG: B12-binding domain-containing radical SAM protein [Candidatus Bathyarchaeota archaeon]|nr:B12-binding domain-containing radical SAM protein [Candidatus Bathyarchaeota archaeon]